jgi:hypothetical protein
MPHLSAQQEERIIDDLTALDWVRDLEGRSTQLISERLDCSAEDASSILERLQAQGLIERVSASGGTPAANRTLDSYSWKWVRGRRA